MHQARIHALYNSFTFSTWDQIQSLEYGRQALTTDSQRYNVYDGLLCGISLTGSIPFPLYNRYDVCQLDFSSKTAFLEISFPNQAFPEVAIVFDPSLCIDAMHIAFGGDGGKSLGPLLLQHTVILGMEREWVRTVREMVFRISFKTRTDTYQYPLVNDK